MDGMATHKRNFRHAATGTGTYPWPLLVIAAPAAVAVWSGWVGLGGTCGFGVIHPLPGIVPGFQINTAITLPVGIESYGAYALSSWIGGKGSDRTRTFAKHSAIGALILGCLGQVVFHLLAAAGWAVAPWPVVMLVACLPVVTLSFAAALVHLTHADHRAAEKALADAAEAERAGAEAEDAELAGLRAELEAERSAREAAEAETGTVQAELAKAEVKAEALGRKLASAPPARKRNRKPAGTRNRNPEPVRPEPEPRPEAEGEESVDFDAEAGILQLLAEERISVENGILQLVAIGRTPSKAGVLAGKSDSYGRAVARKAKELAEAAPKGQDPREGTRY